MFTNIAKWNVSSQHHPRPHCVRHTAQVSTADGTLVCLQFPIKWISACSPLPGNSDTQHPDRGLSTPKWLSSAVQAWRWVSQGCADASAWVWPPAFPPISQDLRVEARTLAFLPIFQQQTEKGRQRWDEPGISLLSSRVLCRPLECQSRPSVVLEGSGRLHTWEE